MADQLSMSALNLGPSAAEQQGQQARTYMPPHMRNKPAGVAVVNGGPPVNGSPGPAAAAAPVPSSAAINGLNNSAWAG